MDTEVSGGNDALVCQRCNLLLLDLIIGKGLLVLLPVLAGGGRLVID